jgi:hypothetical protein
MTAPVLLCICSDMLHVDGRSLQSSFPFLFVGHVLLYQGHCPLLANGSLVRFLLIIFCVLVKEIKQYQQKWLQNVQRMDKNRLPRRALHYRPNGQRNIGRPRKRWADQIHLEDYVTGNTPNPLFEHDDDDDILCTSLSLHTMFILVPLMLHNLHIW